MIKQILFLLGAVLLVSKGVMAQTGEGFSKPGSIQNPFSIENIESSRNEKLICSITYNDPSGDNKLSEDEEGTIKISVSNHSMKSVAPKLEIVMQTSWQSKPRSIVKWMDKIDANGTGTYKATMKWDNQLPAGSITYSVKALDVESGITSDPVEVTFMIDGIAPSVIAAEPVLFDVDKNIPKVSVLNQNSIAVIIGIQDYHNQDVPDVTFALNDAKIMKQYLISMMGFQEANIMYLENADKSDFERIFGTESVHQGKLFNWVKPNISDVFVYYSGHGAPSINNKKAYFIPANSDPNYVQIDGYALDTFYKNLDKIPAKSITVVLDACFSGGSQQGMLIQNASPMYVNVESPVIGNKINLFTSAAGDQIASWYTEGNHSLFTYYYLRALRGEADADRDRKVTVKEVKAFLDDNVPYMARRLYGREQTPVVLGNQFHVLCSY
jgi:hypothetical protein